MSAPRDFTYVGTRPIRHDGVDKVTGRASYGADVTWPGMLHGFVLRSPHAHARIVSIDTSAAEAMPGVQAVITGRDLPETTATIALGEAAQPFDFLRQRIQLVRHPAQWTRGERAARH